MSAPQTQFGIYSSTIVDNITHNSSSLTVVFGWNTVIKYVNYLRRRIFSSEPFTAYSIYLERSVVPS